MLDNFIVELFSDTYTLRLKIIVILIPEFRTTFMIKLMSLLHLLRLHLKFSEIKRIQKINEKFFIMKKIKMRDHFTMQLVLIAMDQLNMKTGVPVI